MLDFDLIAKPFDDENSVGFTNPFDVTPLIKRYLIIFFKAFVEVFQLRK
jgi:hypothetical protein